MCGGIVNNRIKKGFLLSPPVKVFFYISELLAQLRANVVNLIVC